MFIPPTTLAAMQHHHEHLMNFPNQHPQPVQQQEQHFDYQQDDQSLAKRMGQVNLYEGEAVESAKEPVYEQRSPPQQQDTMANIDEWENDQVSML
jgi:hypothetical protein